MENLVEVDASVESARDTKKTILCKENPIEPINNKGHLKKKKKKKKVLPRKNEQDSPIIAPIVKEISLKYKQKLREVLNEIVGSNEPHSLSSQDFMVIIVT